MIDWQDIATAPKDGTPFQAKIPGHGSDNVIAWLGGLKNSQDEDFGVWQWMENSEPPDSWSDGVCWEVNDDGKKSVEPTQWKPLPPRQREKAND
jgi:hypothetical protein